MVGCFLVGVEELFERGGVSCYQSMQQLLLVVYPCVNRHDLSNVCKIEDLPEEAPYFSHYLIMNFPRDPSS